MKISLTFRVFAFLMAVLMFSTPFISYAQQNPVEAEAKVEEEAKAQAIADAENDANKEAWFMAGCFLNIIGVFIARTNRTPVPASRLVGKSSRYIVAYTSSYREKRTEIQVKSAALGCILGFVVCSVACVLAINEIRNDLRGGTIGGSSGWCSPFL